MRAAWVLLAALMLIPRAVAAQGDPVGPEFRVNTYTTNKQGISSVAADSFGNFVVVWTSYGQDGSGFGIFGQRYASSGMPLGPEFRVNTYTTTFQYRPAVSADSAGNFVVVWESTIQDGSIRSIFGQRYASSGTPLGPEFRVNTYTTDHQAFPCVAAESSGNFVVVWESYGQDGSSYGVFGQRFAGSGNLLGPEFRVNTYTTSSQVDPSVAADISGNIIVVWHSFGQDGSFLGVFGQRYASSGIPLGPEFRINTYTTDNQNFASVSSDAIGNFVVVWQSYQDTSEIGVFGASILAQRYASGGAALGGEFRVNSYTPFGQTFSSVASDADGNFVVVWQSYQDSSVFGQRYASAGSPLGPEFRVNTYETGSQLHPAVAADSSGDFVVVWASYNQDGSGPGVFGQRYNMIVPVELMHFRVE